METPASISPFSRDSFLMSFLIAPSQRSTENSFSRFFTNSVCEKNQISGEIARTRNEIAMISA